MPTARGSLAEIGIKPMLTEGEARTALEQVRDELQARGIPVTKKVRRTRTVRPAVVIGTTFKITTVKRSDVLEVEWNFNERGEISGFGWRILR